MKRFTIAVVLFAFVFCFLSGSAYSADKIPVFVSIVPQKYFVEKIGGERVDVQVMVQPGASPATYEPKPRQMADISKTRVYFAIGVPFENAWLDKIAAFNPAMMIVHTDQGIQKIPLADHHHRENVAHFNKDADHPGGDNQGAAHVNEMNRHPSELDPHIWLSPPLVMIQAGTILDALQVIDPSHRSDYETNYRAFVPEIKALDAELSSILAGSRERQFMVFHPSWGYFAHTYGLNQIAAEIEGKAPKPAQLKELIAHARALDIKVIFVQPQFSSKSAELIAREIGGQVVFADPLAEDWPDNLRKVAQQINVQSR
jgi:zinc transport system substrate-binding protein